jgi:hypothetical protein
MRSYYIYTQTHKTVQHEVIVLKERLHDQFIQQWFTDVETLSCIVPIVIQ